MTKQIILLLLIIGTSILNLNAATVTWDGDASDGQWTSATNWSNDVLPTSLDDVVINNGDLVTLSSGTVTVHTISISNNSDLTVNSGVMLNVNSSGFGRTIDMDGNGCEVKNAGTINITGGGYGIYSNRSKWTNQSGGITNISSASNFGYYDNSSGTLTNNGTMTVDGGSIGIRLAGGTVNNNAGGTLTVENTSSSGISVPSSGTISNNGNLNVNSCGGTSISATWIYNNGSGNLSITNAVNGISPVSEFTNSGTVTITTATGTGIYLDDVTFSNSGSITISGTTGYAFDFDDNGYSYTFSNTGTLKGTGTFDMAGNALGGTIVPGTSAGTMTYPVSQTFSSTAMQFEVNGTTGGTEHDQISITGTATISGTLTATVGYTPTKSDRIEIISATAVSGTFSTVNLPNDWEIEYSATKVELVYDYIQGKWDGEAGDGLWTSADNWEGGILPTSSDDVVIDNGNLVTLSSGTVTVHTISMSNASDLTVSSGVTLNVNSSGFGRTIDIDGSGSDVIVGGTINITGGAYGIYLDDADWTTQSGGVTDISSYSDFGYYDAGSGRLVNSGTMTADGGSSGIRITSSGTMTNNNGGTITVENTSSSAINIPSSGTINNSGNLNVNSCGGSSVTTTWLNNNASGIISISNAGPIGISSTSEFNNAGTITITGGTGVGLNLDEINYTNSGTITISGTTGYAFDYNNHVSTTFSNTGTLKGTGIFDMDGNALGGTIVPGTSSGTMTYPVSQTFSSTIMQFEVNGTTPNTQHDQIKVTGTATIGGTLSASFGYAYQNGDRIVIISATIAVSGTFSSDNLPSDWSIDYSQTGEVALVYSGVSLPVELLYFNGEQQEKSVLLTWQTATELNNSHFEIEWSTNGMEFTKIGQVQGAGTTNDITSYDFLHISPAQGLNYYRLKQVDLPAGQVGFDGKYEYTDIIQITFDTKKDIAISIYPNPASHYLKIESQDLIGEMVQVFSVNGQLVKEFQHQSSITNLSITDLPNGTYFIKMGEEVKKIIIQK